MNIESKLGDFDHYIENILCDWNVPGIGVGIVEGNKLIHSKGYGYRDYENKLPISNNTLFQIASNTKLFTAISLGMLVSEGNLEWDKPVKEFVHSIKFATDELDKNVTLRDMLGHRTGISRHDTIWYKSPFTRSELYDRLRYLEPCQPIRSGYLYNNMMYFACGQIVWLLTGQTWEEFVAEHLFKPLGMKNSYFTVSEMKKHENIIVPYIEASDSKTLKKVPYYEDSQGGSPAGPIVSNIEDLSKWVSMLMNGGRNNGRQVIPEDIIKATMEPSIVMKNRLLTNWGYTEYLNPMHCLGIETAVYRGHLLYQHGGELTGIHSQISFMPNDNIGIIIFVTGTHGTPCDIVSYNIYERLLSMNQTPWSERRLKTINEWKRRGKEGRTKVTETKPQAKKPSHRLEDYFGEYVNPAYGVFKILRNNKKEKTFSLQMDFHNIILPLSHYNYDRFDSPDDEEEGIWSILFNTDREGDVDHLTVSLDEKDVIFTRQIPANLLSPKVLKKYIGKYTYAGAILEITIDANNLLFFKYPNGIKYMLIPRKERLFGLKDLTENTIEFLFEKGKVTGIKHTNPSGEFLLEKFGE